MFGLRLSTVKVPTPLGAVEFEFDTKYERKRGFPSLADLQNLSKNSKNTIINFSDEGFAIDKPLEGWNNFENAKFKDFVTNEESFKSIRSTVDKTSTEYGWIPDDMALGLALLESPAHQSTFGSEVVCRLQVGSKINGWYITDKALPLFKKTGGDKISLQQSITITSLKKNIFIEGRLKPTPLNVFISRYRFDIPPNYDSIVSDPKSGSTILTYYTNLENVKVEGENDNRDILGCGFVYYFLGQNYLHIVELFGFRNYMTDQQWSALFKYIDTFRYVKG